jgi:DNA replication factor GINS
MNLDELRSVRRTERQKDSLQHLRDSFYEDVADYIEERKAERSRAAEEADDPFSDPDVGRLTDEIETAEDVVEAIYERRVGKVVKLASFAAADMAADTDGLTAEERDLFEDLVARIKQNRQAVLDVLAGKRSGSSGGAGEPSTAGDASDRRSDRTPDAVPEEPSLDDTSDVLSEAMGGSEAGDRAGGDADSSGDRSATDVPPDDGRAEAGDGRPTDEAAAVAGDDSPAEPATADDGSAVTASRDEDTSGSSAATSDAGEGANRADAEETDRVTVRITSDVGHIFGVDEREYELVEEDVVTLPTTNAEPLLDRGAAERLD